MPPGTDSPGSALPPSPGRSCPPPPPAPVPEAVPVLSVVVHGRGPPARPAAAPHDARPVVRVALQVPRHRGLLAPHLVVGLAEAAVRLVQGAEFRDGVVICGDTTRRDRASHVLLVAAETRSLGALPPQGPSPGPPRGGCEPELVVFGFLAQWELAPAQAPC